MVALPQPRAYGAEHFSTSYISAHKSLTTLTNFNANVITAHMLNSTRHNSTLVVSARITIIHQTRLKTVKWTETLLAHLPKVTSHLQSSFSETPFSSRPRCCDFSMIFPSGPSRRTETKRNNTA